MWISHLNEKVKEVSNFEGWEVYQIWEVYNKGKASHEHHPHFIKDKYFLSHLDDVEENNYEFFGLFPVLVIKQKDFISELDFVEKVKSIEAFIELMDRH